MPNPHGSFIWYELMTPDPDAATRFYDAVAGWTIDPRRAGDDFDYRMIVAPDGNVGGVLKLDEAMAAAGARPAWVGYVGVDDVDATVDRIKAAGGIVFVPPHDLAGVGRFSLLADPQGALLYVMRDVSGQTSTAFAPDRPGHCWWNELATSDQPAALAFYTGEFGWTSTETMPMGAMGDYQFLDHGGQRIGALMTRPPGGPPPAWTFYFGVADIDTAAAKVTDGGGTIVHGPTEVPGGQRIILGTDPQGASFGLVGPGK